MGNREEKALNEYQSALAKSEAQYRQIVENLSDVVWTADLDLRATYISPSVEMMLGVSPEVYMARTAEERFTPDSLKIIHEIVFEEFEKEKDQKYDNNRTRQFEVEHYREDGSTIWISLHMSFLRDKNRKVIGFQGMSRDITERKQAEQELYKSEQRFRVAQEISPDGFTILHPIRNETGEIIDFIFIYENPAVARINQTDPQTVIGKRLLDLFPTHRGTSILEAYINVANTRNSQIVEDVNAGEVLSKQTWLRLVIVSMSEDIAILAQDISERKKSDLAVRESEKLFRTSFESATIGGAMVAKDCTFIDVNDKACEIWGYTRKELLQLKFINITFEEDIAASMAIINKILLGELDSSVMEKRYIKRDGSIIWGLVSVTAMRDVNNEFEFFLVYIQNITEIKETENSLKYLSYNDHLTGLYNRRFFEKEIVRLDTENNLPISIIMCDINGLKLINDSFGHGSGDELLIKAAETIKKACREGDIVSRIGGDEFVIILPKADAEEAVQIANLIKEFASYEGVAKIELSISYGYDTKKTYEQSMIEILANAENHMYRHKLYERSSMRSKTVDLIMNTLFEKSDRESQHSARVSNICQAISSKMNFDKAYVNKMRIAGLVHDIGKMGIDEIILNKAGKLDDFEWEQVKRHPEVGWRILSSANEFSELAQYILNHHERWDGGGYPNGLKGEKIPLEARIITVADAYDAMTSERSYRNGLSQEEAINELKKCSGTQFDSNIVDVFVNQVLPHIENFGGPVYPIALYSR